MNPKARIKQLRQIFKDDQILRAQWQEILSSQAWQTISELVFLEAAADAASAQVAEHDVMVARKAFVLKGVEMAIDRLTTAHIPQQEIQQMPEQWSHIEPPQF